MTDQPTSPSPRVPLIAPMFWALLGVIVLIELVARLFFPATVAGRFEYGYHPTVGFVEKGDKIELRRSAGRRFWPQEYTLKPQDKTTRILVLGDSVPRGSDLKSSYPKRLEAELKRRGHAAEVWNLAVGGNGARRTRIILDQALKYEPDLVVYHVNTTNEFEDEREFRRATESRSWHPSNWLRKVFLFARLYEAKTQQMFWKWLPQNIRAQRQVNDADAELSAMSDEATSERWNLRVREMVEESAELCRANGVPLFLVVKAGRKKSDPNAGLQDHGMDAFSADLVTKQIGVVGMLSTRDVFADTDLDLYFKDSTHFRREGHDRMAEQLADQIEGLMP